MKKTTRSNRIIKLSVSSLAQVAGGEAAATEFSVQRSKTQTADKNAAAVKALL